MSTNLTVVVALDPSGQSLPFEMPGTPGEIVPPLQPPSKPKPRPREEEVERRWF